jgi:hypothetical protein
LGSPKGASQWGFPQGGPTIGGPERVVPPVRTPMRDIKLGSPRGNLTVLNLPSYLVKTVS